MNIRRLFQRTNRLFKKKIKLKMIRKNEEEIVSNKKWRENVVSSNFPSDLGGGGRGETDSVAIIRYFVFSREK